MLGSVIAVSCNKDPNKPNKPNGGDDNGNGDKIVNPVKIALDGAFTDWDAVTEASVKENVCIDMKKGASDDPIQVLKISNDADYVYFYIEFLAELLPQNETCTTWGDSYNGTPELGYDPRGAQEGDDTFREVMHLFIDPDGNDRTGFYPFKGDDDEPCIADLGCENCAQFFMFFKPSTKLVSVAWEQTLVGPTYLSAHDGTGLPTGEKLGEYDYNGTFCQEWPDASTEAAVPVWGWQNPDNSGKGDNDMPRPENWKPAPAQGAIAKVEFAVAKGDLTNLPDDAEEFACGIYFNWGGSEQSIGPLRISYSE